MSLFFLFKIAILVITINLLNDSYSNKFVNFCLRETLKKYVCKIIIGELFEFGQLKFVLNNLTDHIQKNISVYILLSTLGFLLTSFKHFVFQNCKYFLDMTSINFLYVLNSKKSLKFLF